MSRLLRGAPAITLLLVVVAIGGPTAGVAADSPGAGPSDSAQPLAPSAESAPSPLPGTTAGGWLRVAGALLATLAAIVLLAALARRFAPGGRAASLRVEQRLGVSRAGQIALVEVEGRRLLLGITPSQVNLIADLGDAAPAGEVGAGGFERWLASFQRKRETSP